MVDLLYIALIVVIIIDLSGFMDSLKSGIKYILTKGKMSSSDYRLKPLDCSLCMTFWLGILYLLITNQFTIGYLLYVCILSIFTDIFKDTIILVKDLLIKLIRKLQ